MNEPAHGIRFRFTIRTMLLLVLAVGVLSATLLTSSEPKVMWKFGQADGGGIMLGKFYGWPFPFLRVPLGEFSELPADLFLPGLIADLAIALLPFATAYLVWRSLRRRAAAQARL